MPNLPQTEGLVPPGGRTIADITARARAALNDRTGNFWTDARLQQHLKNAYAWAYNQIALENDVDFVKVVGGDNSFTYTAAGSSVIGPNGNILVKGSPGNEQDLGDGASLLPGLPADMLVPFSLEFRLNASETWGPLDRHDVLPDRSQAIPDRLREWEWRGHTIIVSSANQNGFLRIRYLSLLPDIAVGQAPYGEVVVMNNVVEAISYFTAADAFRSRGQHAQATANLGQAEPIPFGAMGFMSQLLKILVLQQQYTARRGKRFTQATTDITSNRSDV